MYALRIIAMLGLAIAVPSVALESIPAAASPTASTTIVVDDDGAQCASADYASIAEAVKWAPAGATVRVCPGRYRERVVVDKPLHVIGQPNAVAAIDCFDPTWTATAPLDPTVLPVVERPADEDVNLTPAPLLRLDADGIEVAGLAVRSLAQLARSDATYTPAIQADGGHSGYRIHGNLIQGNNVPQGQEQDRTFGIEIGSNGTGPSRVDHNCLRGNTWAIANQRYAASSVRIDHNDAFRHGFVTYEIGSPVAGTSNARVDHNRSVSVGFYAFLVEGSDHVRLDNNVAEDSSSSAFRIHGSSAVRVDHNAANGGIGVGVLSGNTDVRISENQLTGGTTGIGVAGSATGPIPNPSTRVVATSNTVHGYTTGILLALNANNSDTVITKNVVRENRLAGIQIGLTNTGALLRDNLSDLNGMFGIRTVPGVTGNSIESNSMHGNGTADAFEGTVHPDGTLGNTWTSNGCDTDSPVGAICTAP